MQGKFDTNIQILSEIRNAISDLYERENQLLALEEKFSIAMNEVQIEAKVSTIDDDSEILKENFKLYKQAVRMQKRLNDVTIEQVSTRTGQPHKRTICVLTRFSLLTR